MRFRFPAIASILVIILLGACDSGPSGRATPPPTTILAQPTSPPQVTITQEAQAPSPTSAVPPTPTTEPTPLAVNKEPLSLSPMQVETTDATRKGALADERTINLPPGFHIKVFAAGLDTVRWLALSPDGVVYATLIGAGRVVSLPDRDNDGVADEVRTFADDLPLVHGIAFRGQQVYVATERQVLRLEDTDGDGAADKREVLVDDLPIGGNHRTRTIAFGPDDKLYLSAGSECNACVDSDKHQAAITRYSPDGTFEKVYAKGLRNAVGILFHPETKELWATNNGRDELGDDIPPETIYNVKEDTDYGFPFCYGDRVPDQSQGGTAEYCSKVGLPAVKMQAHSAPLGLAFYTGSQFPVQFKGDIFVAFHGSWNRSVPTGYKVVRVRMKDNQPDASAGDLLVEDFATGWRVGGDVWGRPVNPMVAPNGDLLLTDDTAGVIYSIYYRENAGP
ncbi:MAG TPA: PQQ-dependent sugar dehydrogenase [Chloroflexia bacterium]|nr:PQQ-dependent sugar dehydrogenase [Chloroflexia bacterium]